ncbi:hypothetical protein MCEMAEM4_00686 [Burkholderiaceae bacterium]
MILIFQIAFGIVLAWFLITRIDTVLQIVLAPFRFIAVIFSAVGGVFYEMLYGIVVTVGKVLKYVLPFAFLVAIVVGLFYGLFTFVPQPYSKYTFFALFGAGLLAGLFVFLKDAHESYKEKSSNFWMFAITITLFCLFLFISVVLPIFNR